ncbi:zinc finger protein [Plasmodium brasilianum]|uniref:Zinc finger protein n=1 Tax=Plasmodium brasilianum TaxID=5824 RepID=A0ACB9Y4L0_PLABR|nr:zinc finger protein [Plasmodium brasilianum]
MIDTFIYWNFKGSKGGTNILRISLPCSYGTIKKKILEVINLELQNSLDILLYHNNRVLSEHESIQNGMLLEVQRSSIGVVKDLLQKSNRIYLEKNKCVAEQEEGSLSSKEQSEPYLSNSGNNHSSNFSSNFSSNTNKINGYSSHYSGHHGNHHGGSYPNSVYKSVQERTNNNDMNDRAVKMNRPQMHPPNSGCISSISGVTGITGITSVSGITGVSGISGVSGVSGVTGISGSNNKPWNVYNRNNNIIKENQNDDEYMKIQEAMERNNIYNTDTNKYRMNYYKKDKNNQKIYQNKFIKMSTSSTPHRGFNPINGDLTTAVTTTATTTASTASCSFTAAGTTTTPSISIASVGSGLSNGGLGYPKYNNTELNKYYKTKNTAYNNTSLENLNKYVSPDYICHMCGKKGHSIKNCTMSTFNNNKKIKVPTGIPTNFLTKIKAEDIYKYDQIYILKDGSYGIMKDVEDVSGSAYLYRSVDDKINIYLGVNANSSGGNNDNEGNDDGNDSNDSIDSHSSSISKRNRKRNGTSNKKEKENISSIYKCLLCKRLYTSPITLHCCGETYCKPCLFKYNKKRKNDYSAYYTSADQKTHIMKCPSCSKFVNADELIINTNIKNVIDTIVKNQKNNSNTYEEGGGGTSFHSGFTLNGARSTLNNDIKLTHECYNSSSKNNSGITTATCTSNNTNGNQVLGNLTMNNKNEFILNRKNNNRQVYGNGTTNEFTNDNMRVKDDSHVDSGNSNNYGNANDAFNEQDQKLQEPDFFNPLINFSININELKKQHEFAAAYIAHYKMHRKKKKKKRKIDLNTFLMCKKVC